MAEQDVVELVAEDGAPRGASTVGEAHAAPGLLHRAFSVVVHDGAGAVLLQQRAAVKLRFAGAWANTCCGHVPPGAAPEDVARRRLVEELGLVTDAAFAEAGVYRYDAPDPASGMVEREYDHVLVLRLDRDVVLAPTPEEVAQVAWVPVADAHAVAAGGDAAPWLAGVLQVAETTIG